MDKNTVTRTFSFGAICSGTKAVHSDDSLSARRHSSAGIRALLWAISSAKSFGSSVESDSQTSRDNIFTNILTPDSIPQFTIPSLSVQTGLRSLDSNRNKQTEEDCAETDEATSGTEQDTSGYVSLARSTLSSSTSFSAFGPFVSDRKAERSVSDPFAYRHSFLKREVSFPCPYTDAQHCLDPHSRAALSLPHLTKVTTPYGFITLSQSPQMASEEALLCQAGLRRFNKDEDTLCCLSKDSGTVDISIKPSSINQSATKQRLSKDSAESQTKGRIPETEIQTSSASSSSTAVSASSSSTAKQAVDSKRKRRFYEVIKKHFTSHC